MEAISNLEDALFRKHTLTPVNDDDFETVNIAEKAIRKQIRKMPSQGVDSRYHCPACDNWIAEYQHFCDNCGQAIDWTWKFEKGRKDETDKC
ncbi:MAG: hypothetical protein LUD72_02935 [Bacteroidales bacterium]|nr:hypothetical protein [Bacteroidales bacterium]